MLIISFSIYMKHNNKSKVSIKVIWLINQDLGSGGVNQTVLFFIQCMKMLYVIFWFFLFLSPICSNYLQSLCFKTCMSFCLQTNTLQVSTGDEISTCHLIQFVRKHISSPYYFKNELILVTTLWFKLKLDLNIFKLLKWRCMFIFSSICNTQN